MNDGITKEISKEAALLLNTINRGLIPLAEIKSFLARVEAHHPPRRKVTPLKREVRLMK